jgi:hypothetical protein
MEQNGNLEAQYAEEDRYYSGTDSYQQSASLCILQNSLLAYGGCVQDIYLPNTIFISGEFEIGLSAVK